MEIAKATSLLSSQAQYVLSHAVSVGYGVCWYVYICVYVYIMQQACHAAVWWQSNKYNKSRLQNSLWFLEVLGRGRVSWQKPKETLSLLCTYRYMYLDDALHCVGPGQRLASAVYVGHKGDHTKSIPQDHARLT